MGEKKRRKKEFTTRGMLKATVVRKTAGCIVNPFRIIALSHCKNRDILATVRQCLLNRHE